VARQAAGGKERREQPVAQRVDLFEWSDRSQTRAFFISLYMAIGKANNLRFLVDRSSRFVIAHGFQPDIDITDQMYQSLSVQMVSAAEQYLARGEYRSETTTYQRYDKWYGWDSYTKPTDGRTARRSFYNGFISTIGRRCMEAALVAERVEVNIDGETTTGALVLVPRKQEVEDFFASVPKGRGSWSGGSARSNGHAYNQGKEAGQRASLGGKSINGGVSALTR
jgi:hypothetical protein